MVTSFLFVLLSLDLENQYFYLIGYLLLVFPELLSHAARTLANLNDDMHGGLLKCLAGAKSFQSGTTVPIIQTTSTYLDKMTQCPFIGQGLAIHNEIRKSFSRIPA